MMIRKTVFGTALLWLALLSMAQAGPLDNGNTLYSSGQYGQAVTAYQQAVAQTQGVGQAKAYYKLGNAYHKLHQDAQALDAYNHAQQADPSLSFASSPQKFQDAVARVSRGGSASRTGRALGDGNPVAGRDQAFQALTSSNVYVDPRLRGVDQSRLQQAAVQSSDNPHTLVKIAVLAALPTGYSSIGQYAGTLHRSLNLGKNGLVVVALSGRAQGVSVVTTGLSQNENSQLARQYAPAIATNPTDGTAQLAQAVAGDINSKEYRSTTSLWLFFLAIAVAITVLVVSASRRRKRRVAQAREPVEALRANVLSGIEYLDGYMDVLPKNNPDSDQVRAFRQSASAKFDQGAKLLDHVTDIGDIQRAQTMLQAAQQDVQQARKALDRSTGGTSNIPGDDAVRPDPLPESQPEVQAIPADQRGVSFFSSQPAPLGQLVPVTITVGGQSRQVLATPAEADELRQGRMPQVRAFNVGGREVPWYEYDGYDPYRDYWRYHNAGWGGFGSGVLAGYIGSELLGSLFAPHYGYGGGGYAPYAFATDTDYYRGYHDAVQSDRAAGFG
ncbi:MAG: tetratricopeptide repeat protein, partial [Armatimonadota bacterium]|nr:tetratricopeptide repeat protein [Armatimonadota bacterium]